MNTKNWIDMNGVEHAFSEMSSEYLINVACMIWNHTEPVKTGPYEEYEFSGVHTDEYFKDSLVAAVEELKARGKEAELPDCIIAGLARRGLK